MKHLISLALIGALLAFLLATGLARAAEAIHRAGYQTAVTQ